MEGFTISTAKLLKDALDRVAVRTLINAFFPGLPAPRETEIDKSLFFSCYSNHYESELMWRAMLPMLEFHVNFTTISHTIHLKEFIRKSALELKIAINII